VQVNAAAGQLQWMQPAGGVVIDVFLREVNNPSLRRAEALQQAMAASMDVGIQERVVARDMPNEHPFWAILSRTRWQ
jgi:hypothetical protein